MARRFNVTLYSGRTLGGFGRFGYLKSVTVADDEGVAEAIHKAIELVAADPAWSDFAKRRGAQAVEVFTWAVTLRSKTDKRKRETFFVHAEDERAALRNIGHLSAVNRFAGYTFGPRKRKVDGKLVTVEDDRVVKVERRAYTG